MICTNSILRRMFGVELFLTVSLLPFLVVVNVVWSLDIACSCSEEPVPSRLFPGNINSTKQKNSEDSEQDSTIKTTFTSSTSVDIPFSSLLFSDTLCLLAPSLQTLCFVSLAQNGMREESLPGRFRRVYQIFLHSTFTRQRANGQSKG